MVQFKFLKPSMMAMTSRQINLCNKMGQPSQPLQITISNGIKMIYLQQTLETTKWQPKLRNKNEIKSKVNPNRKNKKKNKTKIKKTPMIMPKNKKHD